MHKVKGTVTFFMGTKTANQPTNQPILISIAPMSKVNWMHLFTICDVKQLGHLTCRFNLLHTAITFHHLFTLSLKLGMLNDNRKIDYRILLSESLSRFNNQLSKTNDLPTGDLEICSASAKAGARLATDVSAR